MGIENIHILVEVDEPRNQDLIQNQILEARIAEHQRGQHPWGSMRRDCPMCQTSGPSN